MEITERVPVVGAYDVIVAGGGVAGIAAAVSARRAGKRTLLLEKGVTLGGLATTGLINYFEPLDDGRGHRLIGGLCAEFLALATKHGYDTIPESWIKGEPGKRTGRRYTSRYSHAIFALELTELLAQEGVDLFFDTVVSRPVMENGRCRGLVTDGKAGRQFYAARMVVDATGDADVLFRAGVPTVQGNNYFTYIGFAIDIARCKKAAASGRIQDAVYHVFGGNATLYGDNHPAQMRRFEGTTNRDVSEYLILNQRALLDAIKQQDRFSRDVITLPGMAQLRTTRRIEGDSTLLPEDNARRFDDSVCAIGAFDNADLRYEVPFGCLVRTGYENLITCGRSAAGAGHAWDVLRVIPPAILTGQAAGMAAARAIDEQTPIYRIDVARLQEALAKAGIRIHLEEPSGARA